MTIIGLVTIVVSMGIEESAYRHGISDTDINHALTHPIYVHFEDGYQMVIGPDTTMKFLEIGINNRGNVFHAMQARPKYFRRK